MKEEKKGGDKRWCYVPNPDRKKVQLFSEALHMPEPLTTILMQRGITTFESARAFFNPSWDQMHDPFAMKGMEKAVSRVGKAVDDAELICIYGDYDVDGVTSVALLYSALQEVGAHVIYYLPDRHKEGYGLSEKGMTYCIAQGVKLVIAIDCGTRAIHPIQQAKEAGMDVIVCDHHEPGKVLPATVAMLNPKQAGCLYPFKELSGCGIGFKLLQGLSQRGYVKAERLGEYIDLVAISTSADIVPMIDENRVLTACGLQQLQKTKNLGLRTLLKKVQRSNLHTVSGIVFGVAPWINAVGRLSHAKYALELLLATGKEEAERGVDLLEQENQARKKLDDTLLNEALAMVKKDGREKDSSLILFSPDWHKGILGIGAARCVEAHYKPTILLTQQKDQAVGSARSVVGYNIYEALKKCSDLFTAFGGHAYAAGLSLPLKNLPVFQQRFEAVVRETMSDAQRYPKQIVDTVIDLAQITPKFYSIIERMRPFGPGFRQPVFATGPIIVPKYTVYKEKHVALQVKQPSERTLWRAIGFNMAHLLPYIVGKDPLSIAYTIDRNKYNGWTRYELVLKDIKPYQPATAQ